MNQSVSKIELPVLALVCLCSFRLFEGFVFYPIPPA